MSPQPSLRPQLTVDELSRSAWFLGGALALIGLSSAFYLEVDAVVLAALAFVMMSTTLIWPALPARIPTIAHTLAFPSIVAFFIGDLWLKTEVLPAMVRLAILLLVYRAISYRQRRDDLQIIVLGLFLIIVAGVLSVSLIFVLQILIYTALVLALLLVITLRESARGLVPVTALPAGEIPSWVRSMSWGQLYRRFWAATDWRVVSLGLALFSGVVGVSVLLFLLIPRFQLENSLFLDRFISKKAKTGFSDTIRFGDVTEIQQDTGVALSVDVSDQTKIPVMPYWRMLVLDQYSAGTFRLSSALRNQQFAAERTNYFLYGESKLKQGLGSEWTFYLESGVSRFLPLLGHFEVVRFRETQNFRLAAHLSVVQLREEPVTMVAYRVEGFDASGSLPDPDFARLWRNRAPVGSRRQVLQNGVEISGEQDLAALRGAVQRATAGQSLDAVVFAQQVGAWLRANHPYSLAPKIPAGPGDPLVRWLVSSEGGHCELFAGAMVILARTAGFPARVVTGFRGGSWNGYSNNFSIRHADAHAWTEIFQESSGSWLRADPLEPAVIDETVVKGAVATGARLDRSWGAWTASLRVFWYRRIVNFDQSAQLGTLKAVKQATENVGQRLREWLVAANQQALGWLRAPWTVQRFLQGALGMGLAGGLAGWWWVRGRAAWRRWGAARGARTADPTRREAGVWLRRLEDSGKWLERGDAEILADLQRVRFGDGNRWPETGALFRRARRSWRAAKRAGRLTRT
ncbi:MAG: hypothetical protein RL077_256 [Verrucomicrobiota bacterium]|jgi:hypothetical protein